MSRPLWMVNLIKWAFPFRSAFARLSRLPVLRTLVPLYLARGDDLIYLPRDRVIAVSESLDSPESTVVPSEVVERFIEKANYHWIMNSCLCRSAENCQNYPIELGCLFLGEAVLSINPKLGRLVSKAEALEHVQRCREAGLVHLIGRNRLDVLWLGVGPGDRLLTICNCCPCCCLWRILPDVAPGMSSSVHRMPGVKVTVSDRCVGCGTCTEGGCFVDAIHLRDGRASVDDECRGCGRCVTVCPQQAIELTVSPDYSVDALVERISASVDVS